MAFEQEFGALFGVIDHFSIRKWTVYQSHIRSELHDERYEIMYKILYNLNYTIGPWVQSLTKEKLDLHLWGAKTMNVLFSEIHLLFLTC